jgi:cysteine desulfurase
VLLAMGIPTDLARASVRFSLGQATTDADIDGALEIVPDAVQRLFGAAA